LSPPPVDTHPPPVARRILREPGRTPANEKVADDLKAELQTCRRPAPAKFMSRLRLLILQIVSTQISGQ
jgi:hypothetical protein